MRCPSKRKEDMSAGYTPSAICLHKHLQRSRARFTGEVHRPAPSGGAGPTPSPPIKRRSMAKQPRILAGETAAITGAARGIGRVTAESFLRQGMRVAIGDLDLDAAWQTASELGPSAVAVALDVTDRASFSEFLNLARSEE